MSEPRYAVVFYDWHVGLTDGETIIDSRVQGGGVRRRPLPPDYTEIYRLDPERGAAAWACAVSRVGARYVLCTDFVCKCLDGGSCILPKDVRARLEATRMARR